MNFWRLDEQLITKTKNWDKNKNFFEEVWASDLQKVDKEKLKELFDKGFLELLEKSELAKNRYQRLPELTKYYYQMIIKIKNNPEIFSDFELLTLYNDIVIKLERPLTLAERRIKGGLDDVDYTKMKIINLSRSQTCKTIGEKMDNQEFMNWVNQKYFVAIPMYEERHIAAHFNQIKVVKINDLVEVFALFLITLAILNQS